MNLACLTLLSSSGAICYAWNSLLTFLSRWFLRIFWDSACPQSFLFAFPPGGSEAPSLHAHHTYVLYDEDVFMGLPILISGAGHSTWHVLHQCLLRGKPSLSMTGKVMCRKSSSKTTLIKALLTKLRRMCQPLCRAMTYRTSLYPHQKSSRHVEIWGGTHKNGTYFLKIAYLFSHV